MSKKYHTNKQKYSHYFQWQHFGQNARSLKMHKLYTLLQVQIVILLFSLTLTGFSQTNDLSFY